MYETSTNYVGDSNQSQIGVVFINLHANFRTLRILTPPTYLFWGPGPLLCRFKPLDWRALVSQDADFTCTAANVQRTCATFGKTCVGLAKYPNATVDEFGYWDTIS